jgi:hypothetical protein
VRRRFRKCRLLIALAFLAITLPFARPQDSQPSAPAEPAVVKSFRLMQEPAGPAVEILSSRPLVPAIRYIENPPRVVIDLPNTVLEARPRRIKIQADQISTLRGYQFPSNPALTRIVVGLLARRNYTWDAAGNRLVVHLGKNPSAPNQTPFQPPTVASLTPTPTPAVASVRTSGPLAIAQNSLSPGSAVTAGKETAVLDLTRGGEVYVCPGTSVTVTPSQNGHNILIGMNHGALETHFTLDASSDSIMTPDFRIVFPGPGEFHYAVSADSQGNTCVRALPGNTASAIVSEMMGDRTYQVKATDQLVFRMGRLDQVDTSVPRDCGCPRPPKQPTVQVAKAVPEGSATLPTKPAPNAETAANEDVAPAATGMNSDMPSNDLHVQVSLPLVFRADGPPPAPVEDVQALPLDSHPLSAPSVSAPLPPPALQTARPSAQTPSAKASSQRSFFGKVRGFFAGMFR